MILDLVSTHLDSSFAEVRALELGHELAAGNLVGRFREILGTWASLVQHGVLVHKLEMLRV